MDVPFREKERTKSTDSVGLSAKAVELRQELEVFDVALATAVGEASATGLREVSATIVREVSQPVIGHIGDIHAASGEAQLHPVAIGGQESPLVVVVPTAPQIINDLLPLPEGLRPTAELRAFRELVQKRCQLWMDAVKERHISEVTNLTTLQCGF